MKRRIIAVLVALAFLPFFGCRTAHHAAHRTVEGTGHVVHKTGEGFLTSATRSSGTHHSSPALEKGAE